VKMVETATPAAGEFLEVLAVFVAVGGLWFGFHGSRDFGGSIELTETVQISKPVVQVIFELGLEIFGVIPSLSQPSVKVD
jgi:hypothetical protein